MAVDIGHCCGEEAAITVGSLQSGLGAEILGARDWEINETAEELDATDFQSRGCREFISCFRSFTGSFEVLVHTSQCPGDIELAAGNTLEALFFKCDGGWLAGTIHINSITQGSKIDEIQKYAIGFTGVGCLDRTNECPTP